MKGMNTRALVNGKSFLGQAGTWGIEPCYTGEASVQVQRYHPQLEPFSTWPAKKVHLTSCVHCYSREKHDNLPQRL